MLGPVLTSLLGPDLTSQLCEDKAQLKDVVSSPDAGASSDVTDV